MGQIVRKVQEAETVTFIFKRYLLGASFQHLAEELERQPVRYDEGKPWNKNMVARILADGRYAGEKGYPAIISREVFGRAAQIRASKQCVIQSTEAGKVLRRLSGQKPTEKTTREVCSLLDRLIKHPEEIQTAEKEPRPNADIALLERSLDSAIHAQPIDEAKVTKLTMRLAAQRYRQLDSAEYETQRLQQLFTDSAQLREPDADLLRAAVSAVNISGSAVSLTLRNGQIIERKEEP